MIKDWGSSLVRGKAPGRILSNGLVFNVIGVKVIGFRIRGLRLALLCLGALVPLLITGSAQAAPSDPLGFQIQVPAGGIVVHENAGAAEITVTRDQLESLAPAQVRYITSGNGFNPTTNSPFTCGTSICTATADDF